MPASVRDILLLIRTKENAQRALAGISRNMRATQAAADTAHARAMAAQARAQAAIMRGTGATRAQVDAVMANARAWDRHAESIERSRRRTQAIADSAAHMGDVFFDAGLVIAGAGAGVLYATKNMIDSAVAYEKQVRLTSTQVDGFKGNLDQLAEIGRRAARDIAVPFEQVQPALFDIFSSMEVSVPAAEKLLRSFSKAAVAGNTDIQSVSRATIGILNAFNLPVSKTNHLLDVQFQLVQEGVGTYQEWAEKIGLVTPSAVRANQSVEMMAAALAASTRMGISAARSSTAVARAMDAMSNPKAVKNMENLGVKVRDAHGKMLPMNRVLREFHDRLMKMPEKNRVAAILDVFKGAGGTIEARRFLQNMLLVEGNLDMFDNILGEMKGSTGSFEKAYNTMAGGVAAQTQMLSNKWNLIKESMGRAFMPTFVQLLGFVQKLLDWFDKLPQSTKNTIAQFIIWGSVLAIAVGAIMIMIGALGAFVAAVSAISAPVVAVVAGVIGFIAVIGALGAAIFAAYQKSQPFRDLLNSLWQTVQEGITILQDFGTRVYQSFMTNLWPALQNLWNVLQTKVFPVMQQFIGMVREELMPPLREAGRVIGDMVNWAFEHLGQIINDMVIPAVSWLSKFWAEHQETIRPLLAILGQLVKWFLIIAAVIGGVVVAVIVGPLAAAVAVAIGIFIAMIKVIEWTKAAYNAVATAIGRFIIWVYNAIKAMINWAVNARKSATGALNSIKGVFASAGSMLLNAGKQLIQGLVNGIKSMAGAAVGAAKGVVGDAINGAKALLGIHSPSRVFKDIGANVVRGFQQGITGNRKKIQDTMFALRRDIMRSINAADISARARASMRNKWSKRLSVTESRLLSLEARRAGLQTRLAAAQKNLNDLTEKRADLEEKVSEAIAKGADLQQLDARYQRSAQGMIQGLQLQLAAAQKFQTQLRDLAARGLDKETVAQLASAGVESAGAMVNTLANASTADLQKITALQQQIRALAGDTGKTVAGDLYNAGIAAAQGLIKGLNSQIAAITKSMAAIATALVKQIKKELGIRSPSKVFEGIGVNSALGYIQGVKNQMRKPGWDGAFLADPGLGAMPFGGVGFGGPAGAASTITNVKNNDVKVTIHTNEVDPRKTGAQLGWELEGKL